MEVGHGVITVRKVRGIVSFSFRSENFREFRETCSGTGGNSTCIR